MSTFDWQLLRLTAGTSADPDPVASQDASGLAAKTIDAVEPDLSAPMTVEVIYYWVDAGGTTVITGAGRGAATVHVVKLVEDNGTERVQEGPAKVGLPMGESFLVDDVLSGDKLAVRFSATTPVAGAAKIRVLYRVESEEG